MIHRYTDKLICDLWGLGYSATAIGRCAGLTPRRVSRIVRDAVRVLPPWGRHNAGRPGRLPDVVVLRLRRRTRGGERISDLAREIEANPRTVRSAVAGISFRHLPGAFVRRRSQC